MITSISSTATGYPIPPVTSTTATETGYPDPDIQPSSVAGELFASSVRQTTVEPTGDNEKVEEVEEPEETKKEKEPTETKSSTQELTPEEEQVVDDLQHRDQEVRAHEQAHLNAAGDLAVSRAHYHYQTGPDQKRYAVGGDVSIDVSKVADDPQATIDKAQRIRRAAMAPLEPSSTDRQVALMADAMSLEAQTELLRLQYALDDVEPGETNSGRNLDQMV